MVERPLRFPRSVLRRLKEMSVRSVSFGGLRNSLSSLRRGFINSPTTPALRDTKISPDKVRSLYYNTDSRLTNGAFVAKNIIDGTADYIGIPYLSVKNETVDNLINNWIQTKWKQSLWEMYRNTLRDSECWVRARLPFPSPLLADGEDNIPEIEVIDTDRVTPYYNPVTQELERVEILTEVYIEDSPFNPYEVSSISVTPHGRVHSIIEIIAKDTFTYWDSTDNELLEDFTTVNKWGFVPCIQIFNDYDSALHGGSSDLETVYPFFQALHDLIVQTRSAHGYHADPKVQVQVQDVMNFIRNNFPESIVNGEFTGKVSWRGKEVFFMETGQGAGQNESIEFITADLKTSDSVTLMDFIIDCMCMAAGVTESILFRAKAEGSSSNDETERFKTKVARKREMFETYIHQLVKIGLFITNNSVLSPTSSWKPIDAQDFIDEAQALNQVVTAAEVANRSKIISRATYRAKIRPYFPAMSDDAEEEKTVQDEANQENQQQLDLEKKMAAISGAQSKNGHVGINSAGRGKGGRVALPLDVIAPQSGQ